MSLAQAQRRAARFELIARVASTIATDIELDDLIQRAADAIHEILGFANVDIPLLDPAEPDVLVIRARGGHYKDKIQFEDRLPVERGIMGAAVRERRTQLVNDVAADPRYVLPPGVRAPFAELAVPILEPSAVLGVINVEGNHPFDELDRISLEVVAEYLAMAIRNARLFERSRQLAVMEERQRLARELHDNVTQILSSISLIAQSIEAAWSADPGEAVRRARRIGELSQMAFAEMRALMEELKPPPGKQPAGGPVVRESLRSALRRLLQAMVPDGIALKLDFAGYRAQSRAVEEAMCRVCQEAVSNAIRHANAARIDVRLRTLARKVRLTVSDNGCGMRPYPHPGPGPDVDPNVSPNVGMGLQNMRRRLEDLGGTLRIAAARPHGTRIEAELPRCEGEPE